MTLSSADFPTFYRDVHEHPPFPWQTALLERVVSEGWPALIDLPTGSGKTSALDVALFSLALAPDRMPRRTLLVVDRRVIVSQAAAHARVIRDRVSAAATPVTRAVRDALIHLQGPDAVGPVVVAELRGGAVRDDSWAKRPDAALLGASTVDQVGSRLLFRGYGVGKKSAALHAGLLGHDTLLLLDEVHLSEPFRQTLQAISDHFRTGGPGLPERWCVVQMSATADAPQSSVHRLTDADRDVVELAKRLAAPKPARLREVRFKGDLGIDAMATEAAGEACAMLKAGRRRVLVVVNRVDGARAVARRLKGAGLAAEVDLVTGRMRPWDRDEWLSSTAALLQFDRAHEGPPRVVVSTQCIEAGADFDFDGLVTEGASLDALRQRFGRLNRRGQYPVVDAVVLMRADFIKAPDEDPLYGQAAARTWAWLLTRAQAGGADFGIDAMSGPLGQLGEGIRELVTAKPDAPVLLPGHLDLWARTSQRPAYDPDLGPFLHGPQEGQPEVTLVWRADLSDGQDPEQVAACLAAVPPSTAEGLALPIHAARAWLAGRAPVAVADVEATADDPEDERHESSPHQAWRWANDEDDQWVSANDLRPGDVLVVPATRGGLWAHNWDPLASELVADVGDEAQRTLRGWRVRRLALGPSIPKDLGPQSEDFPEALFDWLLADDARLPAFVKSGGAVSPRTFRVIDTGAGLIVRARRRVRADEDGWSTGQDDRASYLGVKVALRDHLGDVERWAKRMATNLGWSEALVSDLALAGRLHDLGKADPRFQALLQGGTALDPELLAKSADGGADRAALRRAAMRAKYPPGTRHELLSVALIESSPTVRALARDWELVLHLIASHHGWCRPFAPAVADDNPVPIRVQVPEGPSLACDSGHALASLASPIPERFHRLQRVYGWWGLAWLEAILRLADHRASEEREVVHE